MTRLKFKGNWNETKGKLKQKYAQLTDDDLTFAEGKDDELLGRLQHKLGRSKEHFDLRSRAFEACSFSAESTRSVPRVALFGNIEVDYRKKFVWKRLIGSIPPTARSFDLLLSVCQWTVLSLVAE